MTELLEKHCRACEGGTNPLTASQVQPLLAQLTDWVLNADATSIERIFSFKNYYHTIAFVNATAYLSNIENHHPDLVVSYNRCTVSFTTHAIAGLSENDFICAAKIDQLAAMARPK